MNMKHKTLLMLFSCIVCFATIGSMAFAIEDASPTYALATVTLNSNLVASCNAETRTDCNEIYISSMYLQRVNSSGTSVYSSIRIDPPSTTASGTDTFFVTHNCSEAASAGNYYRVKVTFWADGEEKTDYSNVVYFD